MQLILKFNRLLSGRLVWAILTLFVVISFVLAGAIAGCETPQPESRSIGSVAGLDVTPDEFRRTRAFVFQSRLEQAARLRDERTPEPVSDEAVWAWIAQQRAAARLGFAATPMEIRERLLAIRDFYDEQGRFDARRYELIVTRAFGMTPALYEAYLAEDIVRGKLSSFAANMAWTSPAEARDIAADYSDLFDVQYAVFAQDAFSPEVEITPEALRAYFDREIEQFRIPEQARVQYLTIPVSNQLANVALEPGEAEFFYNDNIDRYMIQPEGTNAAESVTLPFETVEDRVTQDALWYKARNETRRLADRMIDAIVDLNADEVDLEPIALQFGGHVATSSFFAAEDSVSGVDADRFARTAFALEPNPRSFSHPVVGESHVYILARPQRIESRLPTFDEISSVLEPFAVEAAQAEAFTNRIEEIRIDIQRRLARGMPFDDAIVPYHVSVETTGVFSAFSINEHRNLTGEMPPYPMEIAAKAIRMQQGEIGASAAIDDAVALVYVRGRNPGPVDVVMPETQRTMRDLTNMRRQQVALDWERSVAIVNIPSDTRSTR